MDVMRIVCCVGLCISLGACGFHLRGNYQLSSELQAINLQVANDTGELARALRRSLRSSNVELVDAEVAPELVVSAVEHQRRVLSVDTEGNPQEYELLAVASVAIPETRSGYSLLSKELKVRRDYIFESSGVLSSSDQESQLRLEMERELARRIMRILQSQH